MQIHIDDSKQISAVQVEFSNLFPYLKLEFFSMPHQAGQLTSAKYMLDSSKTIGECRKTHRSGDLMITNEMTVEMLEKQFLHLFGISVQVFRKSGKTWLETGVTDNWTLHKQNEQGRELSDTITEKEGF